MNLSRLGFDQRAGRVAATFGAAQSNGAGARRGSNAAYVEVIPKTDFQLAGATGAGVFELLPLAVGIDSTDWVSAILEVRVHTKSSWTGTQTLAVVVDNIALVPEEPQTLFVATASPASLDITSLAAGGFNVAQLTTPIGSLLRVALKLTTTAAPSSINAIALSVNLVGRFA